MRFTAVVTLFPDLDAAELARWIECRWVRPERQEDDDWVFHDIDIARVRLIYDLRRDLEAAEETVPLFLSLLDQVYELRRTLKAMTEAVEAQPDHVQAAILEALRKNPGA